MKKQLLTFGILFGFVMFLAACGNAEQTDAATEAEATEQMEEAPAPAPEQAPADAQSTETQEEAGTEVQ
ncbi:MAG: hypothetical protein J5I41_03265 [Saprospiraceae bacterium]|jgi:hypothetical protein|nr:hypothetical protein [Saprospiraceae bacterium]